jgi:ankyrin repeat protein
VEHANDLLRMTKIIKEDPNSITRRCDSDNEFFFYNTYPLHHAILMKHVKCAQLLLESGANPNLYDTERHTNPMLLTLMDLDKDLNSAALRKTEILVELLIKHGVHAEVPSENVKISSFQYLLYAVHCNKSVSITKMLLEHGCKFENFNKDSQDRDIMTSLCSTSLRDAIIHRNIESFKLLLLYNASTCFYFPYSDKPFPIASFIVDSHLMEMLNDDIHNIQQFLYVYYLHGGNFWILVPNEANNQFSTIPQRIKSYNFPPSAKQLVSNIEHYMTTPLSLQSHCRLALKKTFRREYCQKIELLPLPKDIISFLRFSDID